MKEALESTTIPEIETGVYEHYKGKRYEVLGVALHSETLEPLVMYKALYETNAELWARPHAMFIETIVIDGVVIPRFKKL